MDRRVSAALGAFLLTLAPGATAFGQSSDADLKQEIEALKKGQQEIRSELQEIKRLIQSRPAARPSGPNVKDKVFALGENPIKGEPTAKLTLIEFLDYQ